MKKITIALICLLACSVAAMAWPYGNVGLNVDEPTEQLDVGGNAVIRGGVLTLGHEPDNGVIRLWTSADGDFKTLGISGDDSFGFGREGQAQYGFKADGMLGGDVLTPWYSVYNCIPFGDGDESTNRASIKVSLNPPGFIFNVNGVIWTNTP